jgi:hypothetical protein
MRNILAVVVLLLLVVLVIGCEYEPANSSSKQSNDVGEGLQTEKHSSFREDGPSPVYIKFTAVSDQRDYDQGDAVHLSISIQNVWKDSIEIVNIPSILIGPFTTPTDKYERISIPSIGNIKLKPKESITASVVWHQVGSPGLYQVEFGEINLGNTRLSGGGSQFFVKYASEKILNKTIEPAAMIKLPEEDGELTFVVKRIVMNEHETVVYFDFNTHQEAPMGFQMALIRSNEKTQLEPEPNHGSEQSDQNNGVINGVAKFNPTTTDITQLQIVITDWSVIHKGINTEIIKGPWKVDIPLE